MERRSFIRQLAMGFAAVGLAPSGPILAYAQDGMPQRPWATPAFLCPSWDWAAGLWKYSGSMSDYIKSADDDLVDLATIIDEVLKERRISSTGGEMLPPKHNL